MEREKEHNEVLGRLEYEKKQLQDESSRLRNLERLQREEADKFKTRITAQIQELEEQRDELKSTKREEDKLLILEGKYNGHESYVPQVNGRYFEDEEEKLNKIQVLQAERVKLLEKDLEDQIVKLHETRDLELGKINAERERIDELAKQQQIALAQVEMERISLQEDREKDIKSLEEEKAKLEALEQERLEIIEKAFQEREQGKQEIQAEKQRLADLQNKYNDHLIGLEQSMLTTQEKMEKERQLEFEFFETEQLMLEELELKQREAAEQMERERKLIEAHYECERQEDKRKLEMEKLKLEEIKREHTSALRNVEEERKKLQLDRQRQQEQMVRDKVRLTNIEKKYKELLLRAEEEKVSLRNQLEKEKQEEFEKFRQEMLRTMSSASSLGRQSPTSSVSSSKRTNSSEDVGSIGKKPAESDELVAEREKLRQQFEQVREQEERLLLKEREMASLNEKDLEYQKKIKDLETELEEERKRREESEKELEGKEVVVIGNGRPPSSVSIQGVSKKLQPYCIICITATANYYFNAFIMLLGFENTF